MTPLSDVQNLPLSGGFTAGVALAPEGLRFVSPVTLTITFPTPQDQSSLIGFGFANDGTFYLQSAAPDNDTSVDISLMHFSGAGVGTGTDADRSEQQKHSGGSAEDTAGQQASDIASDIARRQMNGDDSGMTTEELDRLLAIYKKWYIDSVQPGLDAARTDASILRTKITEYMTWLAETMTWGIDQYFEAEQYASQNAIWDGIDNAINEASVNCVTQSDPFKAGEMLSWAALGNLILDRSISADDIQKVRNCAAFRVDMASTMTVHVNYNGGTAADFETTVNAQVPVYLDESLLFLSGSASTDGTYSHSVSDTTCAVTSTAVSTGTLTVDKLFLPLNLKADDSPLDAAMFMTPPTVTESWTLYCPDMGPLDGSENWWNTGWEWHHQADMTPIEGLYRITGWTIPGSGGFAERTFSRTRNDGAGADVTEDTTFTIVHTPQ